MSPNNIGYRKPPRNRRFSKGKSGNPRGRPKGSRNPATILLKTLGEKVKVQENGRERTIPKLDAIMKQAVNRAASGDPKAVQQLINLLKIFDYQIQEDYAADLPPTELHVHFVESDGNGRPLVKEPPFPGAKPAVIETDSEGNEMVLEWSKYKKTDIED